jgi:cyclohexyl-isocyanide hydratase
MTPITIGMLLFPGMTQLDLTAPYEVFARIPGAKVLLVGASITPMPSEHGLVFTPDVDFETAPPLDILFVPGGGGVDAALSDPATVAYLEREGARARYVTSVCTGALALGAAGLLDGYRATTHWMSLPLLAAFGATPVAGERVVVDRNRVTGGGVTAGLDFALAIAAEVAGPEVAQAIQLMIEYAPNPPFDAGTPETAPAALVARVRAARASAQASRAALVAEAVAALTKRRS